MSKEIALFLGLAFICCILLIGTSSVHAWKFAAVGDIECNNVKNVAAKIKADGVSRTLILGDLGYSDKGGKCVRDAFIGTNAKPAVGNHDSTSSVLDVWDITSAIQTYKTENIRFLSLNTEQSADFQKSRVQGLLNKYKTDTTIDFIIPFMHKPFVTNPSAHHGEGDAKNFRAIFVPMFVANGKVPLVLFGHNHNYLDCSVNDIKFITVGTGGRDPYPIGSRMDDNCKNGISGTDGYLEVEVNGVSMVGYFKDLNGGIREETTFQIIR
jgi:predicted phosphodiesterase